MDRGWMDRRGMEDGLEDGYSTAGGWAEDGWTEDGSLENELRIDEWRIYGRSMDGRWTEDRTPSIGQEILAGSGEGGWKT